MGKIKFLTQEEIRTLIDSVHGGKAIDVRDVAIMEVLFSTGLRVAELVALPRVITPEMSIVGKGGWPRVIFFSAIALSAVSAWNERRTDHDSELLFPMTTRRVQQMIKKRAEWAGMEGTTPHVFRHSFATYILGKTGNIRLCQEMLGHRSITSTQIYTTITNAELKVAHNKLFN